MSYWPWSPILQHSRINIWIRSARIVLDPRPSLAWSAVQRARRYGTATRSDFSYKNCPSIYHLSMQACQTQDWIQHKRECIALQEWSKFAPSPELSIPSDAVRCLGRMLWKMQKQKPESNWVGRHRMALFYANYLIRPKKLMPYNRVSAPFQ